jgi:adenylosuccinate synthase
MKGFIIFQNTTGQLLYSKNYNSYPYTTSQEPMAESVAKPKQFSSGQSTMSKSSIKKMD